MSEPVFDSSAVMAILQNERGSERLAGLYPGALASAVNVAEVHTRLVALGQDEPKAWWEIAALGCVSVPFEETQARLAGLLATITRPLGLSLGDRACLALAIQRKATVYTADRAWKGLLLPVRIEVIR